jgi:hypothetical protein
MHWVAENHAGVRVLRNVTPDQFDRLCLGVAALVTVLFAGVGLTLVVFAF